MYYRRWFQFLINNISENTGHSMDSTQKHAEATFQGELNVEDFNSARHEIILINYLVLQFEVINFHTYYKFYPDLLHSGSTDELRRVKSN